MGFKMRRLVRDKLPPGLLTPGERLLVLEIADDCDDDSREGWPGVATLSARCDLAEDKIGAMLARIAKKWTELRVPVGHGRDGRPFYSKPGHRTTFRFPSDEVMDSLKAPSIGGPKAPRYGGPKGTSIGGPKAPRIGRQSPPVSGGPSPQVSSVDPLKDLSPQATRSRTASVGAAPELRERDQIASQEPRPVTPLTVADRVLTAAGYSDTDKAAIEAYYVQQGKGDGWWRIVSRNGDLAKVAATALGVRPWCGLCDKTTRVRTIEDMYGNGWHQQPCRDCSGPARPQSPHVPYRNPTDPGAYDDWKTGPRRNAYAGAAYVNPPASEYTDQIPGGEDDEWPAA